MSSTVSSSFYRASLIDPPGATPFAVNPNPHNTTAPSTPQRPAPTRRFSSASVIAQITLLGYPPKIQPQSSATRDQGREQQQFLLQQPSPIINNHESKTHSPNVLTTCSPLDAMDEEAGCILIALANHDPNSNGKKLLPATPTTATATTTAKIMTADAVSTTSTASSSSTSTASCDNSPSSTSTKSSLATHNGNSMSIRNLLGGGSSSDHAAELILKPSLHRDPESSADSKNGSNGHVTWQKDDDDEDDPIMILAAAAAVINDQDQAKGSLHATHGYEQHHHCNDAPSNNSRSKRKWHGYQYVGSGDCPATAESADIHTDKRHRYQPVSSAQESTWRPDETDAGDSNNSSGNTKDAFSWQYLSMKQNPRIKRNAMHAYITYMIYTDMTQTQAANTLKHQGMSKLGSDSGSGDNRACDSTVTTVLSPPPPAPTRNGRFSPPLLSTQRQQQQRGTASYRFQMTAGNDEDYVYSTANNRAPVHKSEIPQAASAAKNDNKGSGLPYPTSSHAEMTIPYPSEVGASVDVSTGAPSDWYHRRHRSPYYSSSSGTHINDLTNRMAPTAIVDRPLTAFLWDESPRPASNSRPDGGISLPPFPSTSFPSSSPSPRV